MRLCYWLALGWALGCGVGVVPAMASGSPAPSNTVVRVQIDRGTNLFGTVDVELFDYDKPETVRNFLLYVRSGAYTNSFLHRAVPGFIVQGGGFAITNALTNSFGASQPRPFEEVRNYGRVTNEFSIGPRLTNLFGTIAMAKIGDDPNSATSQWFFNLTNNSANLDNQNGGFTVFGRILESTNLNQGSNVLQHFNTLRTGSGIVNLNNLLGSAFGVFSELPVTYTNSSTRAPTNSELYYVRMSVVGETNTPGTAPPTVTLLSPAANARFTNQPVVIRGTATDDRAVARVVYRVQGGPQEAAAGTNDWQIGLFPRPGFTTVTVEAYDWDGTRSTNPVSSTFFYVSQIPLTLQTNGRGTVAGLTNGQLLQAGTFYTVVAKPARGHFFSSWTGSVSSASASFTFQVPTTATNFSLAANFESDFFPRLAGAYQGLLRDTNSTTLDNTGFMTLSLGRRGAFSGRILHRNGRYSYTGRFDRNGSAFLQGTIGGISRTITLRLDTTNQAGFIIGSYGAGELQLDRLASPSLATIPTNAPIVGSYTFLIAKPASSTAGQPQPGGHGFGTATLSRNGQFKFRGTLGDGTAFDGVSRWTRQNRSPLYLNLARSQGVLMGWISSANTPGLIEGRVQWIRLPDIQAATYPAGFSFSTGANLLPFIATNYVPPTGGRLFKWVNGLARIEGANLVTGISNLVRMSATNSLTVSAPNTEAIDLQLNLKTGLVEGRFRHPWLGTTNLLRGILFTPGESIRGQFVDLDQTGSLDVSITPFLVTQSVANVTLAGFKAALSEGGLLRFETNAFLTLTEPCPVLLDTLLDANGHTIVIRGGGTTRLFEVQTNVVFSAIGLTLADGSHTGADGTNGPAPQPGADSGGAGILSLGGFLNLTNCVFTNFTVLGGAGGHTIATSTNADAPGGRGLGAALCNRGGRTALENCQFFHNVAGGGTGHADPLVGPFASIRGAALGGAVFSDGPELVVTNCTFTQNEARGGATYLTGSSNSVEFTRGGPGMGGALAAASGTLRLLTCTYLTNLAASTAAATNLIGAGSALGGAVFIDTNVQADVQLGVFTGNAALAGDVTNTVAPGSALGGALYSAGSLSLDRCTVEANQTRGSSSSAPGSAWGGALAAAGPLTVNASTFELNVAQGGDWNGLGPTNTLGGNSGGGAIYSARGALFMTNSTLAFNRAVSGSEIGGTLTNGSLPGPRHGGAVLTVSNSASLVHLTLTRNQAGSAALGGTNTGTALGGGLASLDSTITLRNSIFATNVPQNLHTNIIDSGYNFSSDATHPLNSVGSRTNTDVLLGPLNTNGGPTRTMILLATSPARDVIPTNIVPRFDQRGIDRPQGTGGDAGAVEVVLTPTPPLFTVQPVGGTVRFGSNFTFQALATGTAPIHYSWLKDGSVLAGATNTLLTVSNSQPADAGTYVALATNSAGTATSQVATLVVEAGPVISVEPNNLTLAPGASGSFSVVANGPALRYQWHRDATILPSATNATLLISSAAPADRGSYLVVITNLFGGSTSRVATLTFSSAALSILSQPSSVLVQTGATATFSVLVGGVPPFSYQWLFGSLPLTNATNSSLILTNVSQIDAGTYRVVVTNAYASVTSASASLNIDVTAPPTFTLQPTGGVVRIGSNFTLRVQATGSAPITYFWLKEGALLPGATNTTLVFTNAAVTNSGDYAAVAVNSSGSTTSSVVTLTVDARPLISSQPGDVIVAPGANTSFGVVANGPDPAYRWLHNDQTIPNATNANLTIVNAGPPDRGTYQVVITNLYGAATSRLASLTFDATALSILSQPANASVPAGQSATFNVLAGGVPPLTYQWSFGATPLPDATNDTLIVTNVGISQVGAYRVVVTNAYLAVTSTPATLTLQLPPLFILQPTGIVARLGDSFSFQSLASGTAPIAYSWLQDGILLAGATNATLTLTNIQLTNAGAYLVLASNSLGTATSLVATLTLDLTPLIVTEPGNVGVAPGGDTHFEVIATGPDLAYAWFHNNQPVTDATNALLAITNAVPADRGAYQVIITNLFGAATSQVALLTFDTNALAILVQPTNTVVQTGQTATFTVVVGGVTPFAYQWRFAGSALPDETNSALVITNVAAPHVGTYHVVITNDYLSITSAPATLTLPPPPSVPVFTLQPTGGVARAGSNFTFLVAATGTTPIQYSWFFNDLPLAGAIDSILVLTNVQATNAGAYAAVAANVVGSVTSLVAALTVDSTPLILVEPGDAFVAPGAGTNFTVLATGPELAYAWLHDGQAIADATNATVFINNAAPTDRGVYQVVITNLFGTTTSRLASLTFDTNALVILTQPTNVLVATGQTATFTVVVGGVAPFAYQWWFGPSALPDETNSTLIVTNVSDSLAGTYQVVITNVYLSLTSAPATLTIDTNVSPALAQAPLGSALTPSLSLSLQHNQLVITCTGSPGQIHRLLSSDTLPADDAAWRVVATEEMPWSGRITWTLTVPKDGPVFYRAASP